MTAPIPISSSPLMAFGEAADPGAPGLRAACDELSSLFDGTQPARLRLRRLFSFPPLTNGGPYGQAEAREARRAHLERDVAR